MMTISNNRAGAGEIETFAMANCLMLLSSHSQGSHDPTANSDPTRLFSCKTCDRKFPSFQALGGHRASHNKYKLAGDLADGKSPAPVKPKTHACSICGLEFPIGQALGGHMRRHRPVLVPHSGVAVSTVTTSEGSVEKSDVDNKKRKNEDASVPVLKKWNNGKRIWLDLNLSCSSEEIGGGGIVEEEEKQEEESDYLKLELRQPINC